MDVSRRIGAQARGALRKRVFRRGFFVDKAGTTAVEFAMISVPFLGLIGAILETGSVYFRNAQLQMATETASRAVLTHTTTAGLTYQQFINNYVCTWQTSGVVKPGTLSTMFDCSKLLVDIRSPIGWSTSNTGNDIYGTPNPGNTVINMPEPGQIAIVRIVYPMPVLAGFLGGGVFTGQTISQIRAGQVTYNNAWTHMLLGIAAFRVEP